MHVVWFNLELKEQTNKDKVLHLLQRDKRVALTEHHSANTVFSFGRDQGQYGRMGKQIMLELRANWARARRLSNTPTENQWPPGRG